MSSHLTDIPIKKESMTQFNNIIQTIGHLFRSSLGPFGLDKLIFDRYDNDLVVTNDGATILKNLDEFIESKWGKEILKWGKNLYERAGDGIKTFYILLGEFISQVEMLRNTGIPPALSLNAIKEMQREWKEFCINPYYQFPDSKPIPTEFYRAYLRSLINGKLSFENGNHLIALALSILDKLGDHIYSPQFQADSAYLIQFLPGTLAKDTQLLDGILIDKEPVNTSIFPPEGLTKSRIILIRQKLYFEQSSKEEKDINQASSVGLKEELLLSSAKDIDSLTEWRFKAAQKWFNMIKKWNPQIIITERGVDRHFEELCNSAKIILVRRAKPEQFNYLAQYLQLQPIENIENITDQDITFVEKVYWKKIGRDEHFIIQKGFKLASATSISTQNVNNPKSFSIGTLLIGGGLWYICEEINRFLKKLINAAIVLKKNRRFFYGGGNLELKFSISLQNHAMNIPSKLGYVLAIFAKIFLHIPQQLLENCGMNPIDGINLLKQQYNSGITDIGINGSKLTLESMRNAQIYDGYEEKYHLYQLLFEVAYQIVRIDNILMKEK